MASTKTKELYTEELKKNAADTYNQYLAKNGIDSRSGYLDAVANAKVSRELSDISRGSIAESLFTSGLSKSGYADYLKGLREDDYSQNLSRAEREAAIADYKNASGYEKYLADYEKIQNEISNTFIEAFSKGDIFDYDEAYKQAVAAGLNKEFATSAATRAIDAAIENTIERAIAFAKINSLSSKRAKEYAKSLGLSDFYADKVYQAISNFNENEKEYFSSMTPDEYYQYILNQTSK